MALVILAGLPAEKIVFVKRIEQVTDYTDDVTIFCQAYLCQNEQFPLRIDLYLKRAYGDNMLFVKRFSTITHTNILIGDEILDPFSYWLIRGDNGIEKATIPASLLDEQKMEAVDLES